MVAWRSHPQGAELASGLAHMPLKDSAYLYLVAANIGAVIMPWMIFYQQSAVADKKLGPPTIGMRSGIPPSAPSSRQG